MGKCTDWSSGAQCQNEMHKEGLCQVHYDARQEARQERAAALIPEPQAIRWARSDVKATFGAIQDGGRDESGGHYWGGAKGDLHVHQYGDGGAHVKIGNTEYRFLKKKPKWAFDADKWRLGVEAVMGLGNEATTKKLLGAMSIVLAKEGGLPDPEFSELMNGLGYEKKVFQ